MGSAGRGAGGGDEVGVCERFYSHRDGAMGKRSTGLLTAAQCSQANRAALV